MAAPGVAYSGFFALIGENRMRALLLWLLGVPLSVVILLKLFGVI